MPDDRYEAFRLSMGGGSAAPDTKLDMDSLKDIPLSYASCSIGCKDEHTLPKKLDAIASAGFQAIELAMPELITFANQHHHPDKIGPNDFDALVSAAKALKPLLDEKNLKVLILQPFSNFEGWAQDSPERKEVFSRAENWTRIMEAVGTDLLQIGSSDSPAERIGRDRERFVDDLRELADVLAKKGLRIAYENWCWSTHAPDWEDVWDICQRVDRENFGLCLDTFQSAGGEWADPTTASGKVEDGRRDAEKVEKDWKKSCQRLSEVVKKEKIFLLQISDAYRMDPSLEDREIDGQRPRARWSHDYRPLPFEGYLPVVDFTKAVLKTGFRGWFSYEIFDSGRDGKGRDYKLGPWAQQARKCQERLIQECVE